MPDIDDLQRWDVTPLGEFAAERARNAELRRELRKQRIANRRLRAQLRERT